MARALLLVDLQNDFCAGGANSGPQGDWYLCMYVHNLAHEFQYLSGVLDLARVMCSPASHRKP